MVNACVPKKSPDICFGEIKFGIKLALEADYQWKVSLKILNSVDYDSFSDLFSAYLKTI